MSEIDKVLPNEKWEFDETVAKCFDNMLERSIPDYSIMRELTFNIGKKYVKRKTAIIDIGCSNGNAINRYVRKFGCQNTYKLFDTSEPMLEEARARYKSWIDLGIMEIDNLNVANGLPHIETSLVLSVLTLQFTPVEYRQRIIQNIYDILVPHGAFIFVEKVLGNGDEIDSLFVDEYYSIKQQNGYTEEQIRAKRKSLENVLIPLNVDWNVDMLKKAGFKKVDMFWRCLNFCGWIAIK